MISWRIVKKNETDLLCKTAKFEEYFPRFYRDSSNTWTTDEKAVLEFYQNCATLIGLFQEKKCQTDSCIGLVYFELIGDGVFNVHLDIERGAASSEELTEAIKEIRDYQFLNGLRICMAWTLARNKAVQTILTNAGFLPTFLEMRHGYSHNKILKWTQYCIARR